VTRPTAARGVPAIPIAAVLAMAASVGCAAFAAIGIAGLAGLAGLVGCAHQRRSPPDVVRAFADFVVRGDWDQAYSLMSEDYRRRVSLAAFRGEMEAERKTVAGDASRLAREDLDGPVAAVVRTRTGDRVRLTFDRAGWKLEDQPLAPFGQQSPRAALRTFVRAVEQRRYDVVLRLVPERRRGRLDEQTLRLYWEGPDSAPHRRLLSLLRANLEAPIVELGTEAHMPYSESGAENDRTSEGEVRFLFEEGVWKVEDVH
jgi:hypothetical protein